jgi:hypothetical protein
MQLHIFDHLLLMHARMAGPSLVVGEGLHQADGRQSQQQEH